jgi:hypothetical protein
LLYGECAAPSTSLDHLPETYDALFTSLVSSVICFIEVVINSAAAVATLRFSVPDYCGPFIGAAVHGGLGFPGFGGIGSMVDTLDRFPHLPAMYFVSALSSNLCAAKDQVLHTFDVGDDLVPSVGVLQRSPRV